jgi:hypothetical protein
MYMFGSANWNVLFGDSSAIADTQDGINVTGQGAKYLYMKRHLTANTAGNNFVVQAGWATSWATDKDGGDLALILYSIQLQHEEQEQQIGHLQ